MMKVTLFFGGMKNRDSDIGPEVEDILNYQVIELSRVPNMGEIINIAIGDFSFSGRIAQVFTTWLEPGNKHIKEGHHGEQYAIMIDEIVNVGF